MQSKFYSFRSSCVLWPLAIKGQSEYREELLFREYSSKSFGSIANVKNPISVKRTLHKAERNVVCELMRMVQMIRGRKEEIAHRTRGLTLSSRSIVSTLCSNL